tara:strand:- start:261 stop:644 length:384 start_codon:yes stop_codon:yes gene_type:complete
MDTTRMWDYRVVRQTIEDGDEWYSIQEVYYDDETGKPTAQTADLQVEGDTITGIRTQLERMLKSLDEPVVDEIQNDVIHVNMEDRILALEMENAEMRDRLKELGDTVKYWEDADMSPTKDENQEKTL